MKDIPKSEKETIDRLKNLHDISKECSQICLNYIDSQDISIPQKGATSAMIIIQLYQHLCTCIENNDDLDKMYERLDDTFKKAIVCEKLERLTEEKK